MYLFSRIRTARPDKIPEATAYATEIAETVNRISGIGVRVWTGVYGVPLGHTVWSAVVPSQAAMGVAGDKLLADSSYLEAVQAGQDLFEGPIEDRLVDMVALAGDGGHGGDFASLVQAQIAGGHTADAMAWGVDILNHVAGITGRDGVFGRTMYGPFGGVGWITMANSLDEVDAAAAAMAADTSYLAKLDAAGDLFVAGAASSSLTRRIG